MVIIKWQFRTHTNIIQTFDVNLFSLVSSHLSPSLTVNKSVSPCFSLIIFFRRVSDIGAGANIELITRVMIHSVSRDNWSNLTSSDTVTSNFASFQKYRSLFVRKTYLSLPRMPLHKLIGFKFFFLVWHNSGHFEKESWFCGWHLGLSVWLLVVVWMVTRVGMSEHFPVMSPGPRARVLGCGVVTEGEHVEGGRGGAVQHGGAPHSLHRLTPR